LENAVDCEAGAERAVGVKVEAKREIAGLLTKVCH